MGETLVADLVEGAPTVIRGRVIRGSVVCQHGTACGRCRGSLILVQEGVAGRVILSGEGTACVGRDDPPCCRIDVIDKDVVARGTLHRDEHNIWIDASALCIPD